LHCSIINFENNYYVHTGNHTFAALKAEENYANIKSGMSEIIDTIKELITDPKLTVNDVPYKLNIILGGDYKVSIAKLLAIPSCKKS
jgi:hypothetical protein